jgi:hypothetical protein
VGLQPILLWKTAAQREASLQQAGTFHTSDGFFGQLFLRSSRKEFEMRLSLLAAFLIALMTLPAEAARPVKGAVQGTATAATGIAKGAGQAGVGVVRGTTTAVRGTARGLRCVVTLGNRC